MSKIVEGLKYSESHEWVKVEDKIAIIGVSDFAQKEMGEITYVDMPEVDDEFEAGDDFGALESVKASSELYCPVSGKVVEVNEELENAPEKVNEDALNMRFKHVESLKKHTFNLMTTAAVDVRYKGQEYVIKAIPHLKNKGINITYYIVGDGDQSYLKSIASKYGVEKNIVFTGRKRIDDVFRLLDDVDIYIQPSLQEGLPRSVIEAMSRGCIVIGARTAGIPELIDDKYVVRKKSVSDIYKLIYEIDAYDKKTIMQIAKRNIEKSKEFEEEVLNKRRYKYYQDVRNNIEK